MKMSQALAAESQERLRRDEAHKWYTSSIRSMVMDGHSKTYTPRDDDGEPLPPDEKLVQDTCDGVISELVGYYASYVDAVGTKDHGNLSATADVVLEGEKLLRGAPVPFLLFLEKTFGEWRGYINALPVRDRAKRWVRQEGDVWETEPVEQNRTIKEKVPVEVSRATMEHPAQVMVLEKSVYVGSYQTTHLSGAMSQEEKERLLRRCDDLIGAIRSARELANTTEVERVEVAAGLFATIFE